MGRSPQVAASSSAPALKLTPIVVAQIYEQVVESVESQIRAGLLTPGDRLPSERELARTLQVSRPSVREALASLLVNGIITTRRGAGSFVAPDALERLAEESVPAARGMSPLALLEVREFLEPAAAGLASRLGKRDRRAEELLASMENVVDIEDPSQRTLWSETDRLFHQQIGLMTENPVLSEMVGYVATIMSQSLWRRLRDESLVSDDDRIKAYVVEHRAIYDAVVAGDHQASVFFAGRHVRTVRHHMALDAGDGGAVSLP